MTGAPSSVYFGHDDYISECLAYTLPINVHSLFILWKILKRIDDKCLLAVSIIIWEIFSANYEEWKYDSKVHTETIRLHLAVTHISFIIHMISNHFLSTLGNKMVSRNGLSRQSDVHISTHSKCSSILLTCHSTQNPPPDQGGHQSVAPAGLASKSFPVADSRSHRAPATPASLT